MKTKLTLNLDKAIIERGKKMAKKEHKSLSLLVEELLKREVEKDTMIKQEMINKISGMFGNAPENIDWKKEIREAADKKYGK